MDDNQILEMLFSDSDKAFFLYEMGGGDYSDLKNLKIGKLFAQKRFPEIDAEEYADAVEFMFWISYYIDRELADSISEIEVALKRASKQEIEGKLEAMTLGTKIQFLVDKKYVLDENDPYIVLLKRIRDLRNDMAHGRLHKLEYAGRPLSHPIGQIKLTVDLRNTLLKKNIPLNG